MRAATTLLALAALAGCGGSGKKDCDTRAEALGAWMSSAAAEVPAAFPRVEIVLVERDGATADVDGPVVSVTAERVAIDGGVDFPTSAAEDWAAHEFSTAVQVFSKELAERRAASPGVTYVAVAPDVSWQAFTQVVDVVDDARFSEIRLLFRKPRAVEAPGASKIDEQIEAAGGSGFDVLGPLYADVYGGCAGAEEALTAAVSQASLSTRDVASAMADTLPGEIAGCKCEVDLASARALFWATFGGGVSEHTFSSVPLIGEGRRDDYVDLRLKGDVPWSAAAPKVLEAVDGGKLVWPRVDAPPPPPPPPPPPAKGTP